MMVVTASNIVELADARRLQRRLVDKWMIMERVGECVRLNGCICHLKLVYPNGREIVLTDEDFQPHGELGHVWRGLDPDELHLR